MLKSDFRYFNSSDDGANGHDPAYYTIGDYGTGITKGKVDNNLFSGLLLYTVSGHTFGGGYQVSNGDSDFPRLNQGDGSLAYLTTVMQFARAGERTWQARYSYDFAQVGAPGLTAGIVYLRGDNIDTSGNVGTTKPQTKVNATGASEWERDLTVAYVIPQGPLKNLGLTWKNAMWRNDIPGPRDQDQDENRLIVSYSIPLL